MNPPNLAPKLEVSVLIARQIPFGVLTEPFPFRYFDVISTAVPVPLAVNEAPPTFMRLLVLVTFIADEAVKSPKILTREVFEPVPESVSVILLALIVAKPKPTLLELPLETLPRVMFKSPVPKLSVLVTSMSELSVPLLVIVALLAIKFKSPFAVVILAEISISTPAFSVRSPPELPVAIISL